MSSTSSGFDGPAPHRSGRRGRTIAALLGLVLLAPSCGPVTEAELRGILANSAATTTVGAITTAFTTTVGAAAQTLLQRWMNHLFGIRPILR